MDSRNHKSLSSWPRKCELTLIMRVHYCMVLNVFAGLGVIIIWSHDAHLTVQLQLRIVDFWSDDYPLVSTGNPYRARLRLCNMFDANTSIGDIMGRTDLNVECTIDRRTRGFRVRPCTSNIFHHIHRFDNPRLHENWTKNPLFTTFFYSLWSSWPRTEFWFYFGWWVNLRITETAAGVILSSAIHMSFSRFVKITNNFRIIKAYFCLN